MSSLHAEPSPTALLHGLIGYASLCAFERLAADSGSGTPLGDRLLLARLAASRFDHVSRLERVTPGLDAEMDRVRRPLDEFERATVPGSWLEILLRAHLTLGLGRDAFDLLAPRLPAETASILDEATAAGEMGGVLEQRLRAELAAAPEQTDRLRLFGRRVIGEALGQVQRIAARESALTTMITRQVDPGEDLAEVARMLSEVMGRHNRRMESLGLG